MLSIFPEARREAVERGLSAAFGTTVPGQRRRRGRRNVGARRSTGSGSAGSPTSLRIENGRDDFRDPHRSYACMRIAAQAPAGAAPCAMRTPKTAWRSWISSRPAR